MSDYYLLPMHKVIYAERMKYEKDLKRAFKKDLTKTIIQDCKERINHKKIKNWVVVQVNGETGSMKSSVLIAFMKEHIDPTFNAERITQEYETFLELLDTSKPKQAFILDELVFQRGMGSTRMKEELLNLTETLRKRQNSMGFATPTEKFISDENVTYTLEPCGFNDKTKTVRCLVRKNNRYIGLFYQKLLWEDEVWQQYEILKDAFLEATKSQKYKKMDYEKKALEIINKCSEQELKNIKRIKLAIQKNAKNLTTQETDLLAEQIKIYKESGLI